MPSSFNVWPAKIKPPHERAHLNTPELELIVDAYPGIRLLKSKTQYEALYETRDGKHLAIERRSKIQFKLYLEKEFDPRAVTFSGAASIDHLAKNTKRIHISSERLAGPYKDKQGSEAWLLRLSSEKDLRSVLQSYTVKLITTKFDDPPPDELVPAEKIQHDNDESAFAEGMAKYEMHRRLERDVGLSNRAKANRFKTTGKLQCEVCDFDFTESYGSLGEGYIEAHHTKPLSQLDGTEKTKLESLAMVCSNCHRMLHRSNPMITPSTLRKLVGTRRT